MCPRFVLFTFHLVFIQRPLSSAARLVDEMPGLTGGNDKILLDLLETLYRQEVNS